MTNDTLSTKMAAALTVADAERAEAALLATYANKEDKETTTFIQTDEDVGHRAPVQV